MLQKIHQKGLFVIIYWMSKTKYILNSGGLRNSSDKANKFFNEVVTGLGSRPKILLCLFAQPREVWEVKYSDYTEGFMALMPSKVEPRFELAFPSEFERQVKDSDVVYSHGGDDHLIQYWLQRYDLPELWKGKVVATSSASSNALARQFWTSDWRECLEGLGILPIKFLPHFKSDYGKTDPRGVINWEEAKQELAEYGDISLPIYALREGEFEVFEV